MTTTTKTKTNVMEDIVTINNPELLTVIEERQKYKQIIEEAEAIVKEFDAKIKKAIENSGSNIVFCGEHKVSLSKFTKETVSAKEVKKFVSDELFEQLVTRTITTRLTVK